MSCIGHTYAGSLCLKKAVFACARFPGFGPMFCPDCFSFVHFQEQRLDKDQLCRVCRDGSREGEACSNDISSEIVLCANGENHGDCWTCIRRLQPCMYRELQRDLSKTKFLCYECLWQTTYK